MHTHRLYPLFGAPAGSSPRPTPAGIIEAAAKREPPKPPVRQLPHQGFFCCNARHSLLKRSGAVHGDADCVACHGTALHGGSVGTFFVCLEGSNACYTSTPH